jgi:hypothetical protein
MARIARGRWTHTHEGDLTVFLIGMRINALHRPDAWLPTLAAMGPMLAELARDPDSGFLGYRMTLGWRGPVLVQYWRSVEDVYRYAMTPEARHRPRGPPSTGAPAASPERWGSGTRPTRSPVPRASTSTCRCRGWPPPRAPAR